MACTLHGSNWCTYWCTLYMNTHGMDMQVQHILRCNCTQPNTVCPSILVYLRMLWCHSGGPLLAEFTCLTSCALFILTAIILHGASGKPRQAKTVQNELLYCHRGGVYCLWALFPWSCMLCQSLLKVAKQSAYLVFLNLKLLNTRGIYQLDVCPDWLWANCSEMLPVKFSHYIHTLKYCNNMHNWLYIAWWCTSHLAWLKNNVSG